jgi:hypothetical protein
MAGPQAQIEQRPEKQCDQCREEDGLKFVGKHGFCPLAAAPILNLREKARSRNCWYGIIDAARETISF